MKHLALIRSMTTKEGDHGRATYYLRTGYMPQGQVQLPAARVRSSPRSWRTARPTCRAS